MILAERAAEKEEGGYKMEVEVLENNKEKMRLSLILKNSSAYFVSALRRMISEEVPVLAIEDIEIADNSSAMYDEMIAHRLGLMPISTDLKSYELPEECSCKGAGCAKCQLKMTLKAKGPGIICADEIKSKDPKCKPVFAKMPIIKLTKGQSLELEATAVLGKGKIHSKWVPALAYFKAYPQIEINAKGKSCKEAALRCPQKVFDFKNNALTVNKDNLLKCHLCEDCVDICPEGIKVTPSEIEFIFTVESWGQLEPKEIVKEAVALFDKKIENFLKLLS